MSLWDVKEICQYAKSVLDDVTVIEEICNATTIRQQAMTKIPEDVDLIYVVGDTHSNNTTRLAGIGKAHTQAEVILIDSINSIQLDQLKGKKHIAVTAGASTPTYLTNMIIQYLEQLDFKHPETFVKPEIDFNKILS